MHVQGPAAYGAPLIFLYPAIRRWHQLTPVTRTALTGGKGLRPFHF